MSLSCASASSQYMTSDPALVLMPNWRAAICFFRTTTSAAQTLMQCIMRPTSTTFYERTLSLAVAGSTVEVAVDILDNVGTPSSTGATTSGGIDIGANGWNCAGCSISPSQLDVWLARHDGGAVTPGGNSHTETEGGAYNKHSVGGRWVGGNYMNGQIGHAIAYQSAISVEDFNHVALGRADPRTIGSLGSQLIYHFPFVDGAGVIYGTNDGQPVKDNGTSTVNATTDIFDGGFVGGSITFDATSTSYPIATFVDANTVTVTGDASGEGAADTFVAQTNRYSAKFGAALTGGSAGETLFFDAQNGPTRSLENPNVFSAAGLLM